MAAFAQAPDLTPRSPLEAIVLGDAQAAQIHLEGLARTDWSLRGEVVADLLSAGFTPDHGTPDCAFYGYHRRTTEAGVARSVQVAMCKSGKSMVLVQDVLPPGKRGGGMSQSRQRNDQ
ncbi:hypothetical protein [Qipengyuania zhejiangensis]|uniref:hypothetical protein n=1 Tax=Qipengyuania zhejiangensis TaxID=3077782 RepID=UPI002D78C10E|nr:hypothetical protein [Qipengyuania sp. Z2]